MKITVKITFGVEIIFFFFVASAAVSCFLFDSLQVAEHTDLYPVQLWSVN